MFVCGKNGIQNRDFARFVFIPIYNQQNNKLRFFSLLKKGALGMGNSKLTNELVEKYLKYIRIFMYVLTVLWLFVFFLINFVGFNKHILTTILNVSLYGSCAITGTYILFKLDENCKNIDKNLMGKLKFYWILSILIVLASASVRLFLEF